ncbi:nucleotidyltransferase domain-containing protein [Paenibacillus cremeus]|uniref:Nucleotidyltransferase family protein n=1 Tax=Paenibacillus cremeus TaxID=2163881 RepID=A0A559K0D6_9BACL|nr:nucleotidyltransferase family protein [Paenibacillus cremeus]TVY05622.1 nucleotidyltransferase family protein [Paenibacillus cremeus]
MIIQFVQILYGPQERLPVDTAFYEHVLADIEFFGISSQIYSLLKQRGQLDQTPRFFQERLKQNFKAIVFQNMFVKSQLEGILNKLEETGVDAIPLKGVLFAEKYFGHLGARGTSDIDLLIKPQDMERAIACVKSLGFDTEVEFSPDHFHREFIKQFPGGLRPLMVELHWDLLKQKTSDLSIEEFWSQAKPLGAYRHIKEFSEHHNFYMICLHGWRHNLNSLKYVLDILQMIYVLRDELEYSALFRDAAAHKTLRRMKWTLATVYKCVPQLNGIKKLPLTSDRLWWSYNAIRELKYNKINQYLNIIYSQFLIFDSITHGIQAVRSELLPAKR